MRRFLLLSVSLVLVAFCCSSPLWAYILTFDDIPVASGLRSYYGDLYGAVFTIDWNAVQLNGSGWAQPHSGTHAAMWEGTTYHSAGLRFGKLEEDDPAYRYSISSIGGYFSTDTNVVVRMIGYNKSGIEVSSAEIGALGESWGNRYVEITSTAGGIDYVVFEGISSLDARNHFSMDDLTIVPVPEPSSIASLGFALLPLAGYALHRKRSI